jgi:hypothetical protein
MAFRSSIDTDQLCLMMGHETHTARKLRPASLASRSVEIRPDRRDLAACTAVIA